MRTLMLLRHAKSDWDASYDQDHDRPLSERGIRAAPTMGRFLRTSGEIPDSVLCSTAVRARQTLELAAAAGRFDAPVQYLPELYGASAAEVLEAVRAQPDTTERLLLVGHQPTWSEVAGLLIGGASVRMPTAALIRIDFATSSWSGIDWATGLLVWHVHPKLLARIGA